MAATPPASHRPCVGTRNWPKETGASPENGGSA